MSYFFSSVLMSSVAYLDGRMNWFRYSFTIMLPWFRSENSFFFSLRVPWGT
jgi:hypothetical protein